MHIICVSRLSFGHSSGILFLFYQIIRSELNASVYLNIIEPRTSLSPGNKLNRRNCMLLTRRDRFMIFIKLVYVTLRF